MRELFLSEHRTIRNALRPWNLEAKSFPPVHNEYYSSPRLDNSESFFNLDFMLYSYSGSLPEHRSYSAPVMPHVMGAEVFVTIEPASQQLLICALNSGEAFPLKYFNKYVTRIEAELKRLDCAVSFKTCRYSRIFVIEGDICFLAFPTSESPEVRGRRRVVRADSNACIALYDDDGQLVCVDGWMATEVERSDWYLVAEPNDVEGGSVD